ncbi:MAG: hypothetical protein JW781_04120, partial [Deltaproteobacteria bacterium]|nr:hypothetical protein [Candidatus Anaeroferrophillacea bacterium]
MRVLTETLLAAQQQNSRRPCLEVNVANVSGGVVRADWQECYAGAEPAGSHAVASASDGSLVRVRVTPLADARKLYRQRVASPGPEADFSQWTYTGYYNVVAVAAAACGNEVSIVWIESNRQVRRIVSSDGGVTFGSPEIVDYAPSTGVNGVSAAYRPGGNLTVFFVCQSTLYVKKRVGGSWQARTSWDKTTGQLTGVAAAWSTDWLLLVSGQDTSGAYRLWSVVMGDGGALPSGSWSALLPVASAPAGGDFQYRHPFLAVPDVVRCTFVEVYSGELPYQRVFISHVPPETFSSNLWCEPVPLPLASEYGLALASAGNTAWASTPAAVLGASLLQSDLDISADVT